MFLVLKVLSWIAVSFIKKISDFKVMNAENLHEWMNEFVSNVPSQRREISQHLWEVRWKLFDINRFVKFATIPEIPSFHTKTLKVYFAHYGIAVGKLASKIDVSDVDALSNSNPLSTLLLGATRLLPLLQLNQGPC